MAEIDAKGPVRNANGGRDRTLRLVDLADTSAANLGSNTLLIPNYGSNAGRFGGTVLDQSSLRPFRCATMCWRFSRS